jgi:hypothetical protein
MEDVLEVYTRPYDPCYPQVCMDEVSKQLLRDVRQLLPMEPGRVKRRDYEYERGGVVNVFLFCEPLQGRRWVDVTERRTKTDWAHQIKELVDERYPEAERIVLVMDNLNTHTPASLYEAFDPAEARRLANKLEIHYTPKHGSWLNMWPRSSSACSAANASTTDECPTSRASRPRREPGKNDEMPLATRSTGASLRRTRASSSSDSILHFRSNGALGVIPSTSRNLWGHHHSRNAGHLFSRPARHRSPDQQGYGAHLVLIRLSSKRPDPRIGPL